jgi:predicted enzyme related to lactoylglutathione lyase
MADPVVHFEVVGRDADALQGFYSAAFGWEFQKPVPEYGLVAPPSDGSGIGGGVGKSPDDKGHVTFYVQVGDPAAALAKIEELGGRTLMGPDDVPGGPTIALFADPEGHVVGLVKA